MPDFPPNYNNLNPKLFWKGLIIPDSIVMKSWISDKGSIFQRREVRKGISKQKAASLWKLHKREQKLHFLKNFGVCFNPFHPVLEPFYTCKTKLHPTFWTVSKGRYFFLEMTSLSTRRVCCARVNDLIEFFGFCNFKCRRAK